MVDLDVPDMSCGHCRATVEQALTRADPSARVEVDLGARRVRIEGGAPLPVILAALEAAGYPATPARGGA